tara:strand:+ start:103 stop:753 length:651 start_codon:yes stop_codon:yes gene_type:complete
MISKNFKKRVNTSLFLLLSIILMFKFNHFIVFALLVLGVISILEFIKISKLILKNKFFIYILNIVFIIYISIFCFLFYFFSSLYLLKIILFCILLSCIASDIGGYTFGNLIGGPKLTKISPNKTISGAIGSIVFSILVFIFSIFYFTENFTYKTLIVGLITSITCQCGDLVISLLKRKAKVKNTGNLLPGHGGILDRIDGIILGVPFGFLTFILTY